MSVLMTVFFSLHSVVNNSKKKQWWLQFQNLVSELDKDTKQVGDYCQTRYYKM